MTYLIFAMVAAALYGMAHVFGITYNTANIVMYYIAIPLSWALMLDRIVMSKCHLFTLAFGIVWILIAILTLGHFQQWCDGVFQQSVDFLMWFKHWGWDYYKASVYICVWLPLLIYGVLIALLFWRHPEWNWRPWAIALVSTFAIGWLAEYAVLTFATRLEATHQRTGHVYALNASQRKQIEDDTRGMNVKEIVNYAEENTCRALTFSLSPNYTEGECTCVDYAAMCVAIANHAFQVNGLKAKATHSVGTITLLGIDMCRSITNLEWVKHNSVVYRSFKDHDFVTIQTVDKTFHVDPCVKDVFGYDLRTMETFSK